MTNVWSCPTCGGGLEADPAAIDQDVPHRLCSEHGCFYCIPVFGRDTLIPCRDHGGSASVAVPR